MPLAAADFNMTINWALAAPAVASFQQVTQGPDSKSFALGGLTAAFNEPFIQEYTIAHAATQTFDFSSFTNLTNETAGFSQIFTIMILNLGVSTATAILAPGAANTLSWFFGGTTPTLTIPALAGFAFSLPTSGAGFTVTGGAGTMQITAGGTGTLTVDVIAFGLH